MVHALYAPTAHKLCPPFHQQAGEVSDLLCRQAADFSRPFGIFRLFIGFAQQIRQKLLKADGVIGNKRRVVQFFFVQGMRQRQH